MNRRKFIKKTSVGIAAVNTVPYWGKVENRTVGSNEKPNILMIAIDSTKATALSIYGNKYCNTPNIDRLAKEGITISHSFCSVPKSVPNRSTMLTGRYPHVDGIRALGGKKIKEESSNLFVITKNMKNILKELLDNGYNLCHKGVNHIVGWEAYSEWFKYSTNWEIHKQIKNIPVTETDPELLRAKYGGAVPEGFNIEKTNDADATNQMIDFLNSYNEDKPFFAYLDMHDAPHPTYFDWPEFRDYYKKLDVPVPPKGKIENVAWNEQVYRKSYDLEGMSDEKWKKVVKAYYSGISFNDMLIGRVMDAIEKKGLSDNTIVIFCSDHGDYAGDHGCTEKHDPLLHDSLTRLPFVVSCPGKLKQDLKIEALMEQIDIAPTVLDFCGIPIPEWIQGKTLLPLLKGETKTHKEVVFAQGGVEKTVIDRTVKNKEIILKEWEKTNYYLKQKVIIDHPGFMMRAKMVRTMEHKLIYRLNGHHEFYDLVKDPDELVNQINNPDFKEKIFVLREKLIKFMMESENNLPLLDLALA